MDESGTGFGADLEHSDDLQAFSEWLDVSAEQHASHDSSLAAPLGRVVNDGTVFHGFALHEPLWPLGDGGTLERSDVLSE